MSVPIERLLAATAPNRGLDAEIENLLAGGSAVDLAYILKDVECATRPLRYTASLDAAMSLLPPDWCWYLQNYADGAGAEATIWAPVPDSKEFQALGATPALAVCAAVLLAKKESRDV